MLPFQTTKTHLWFCPECRGSFPRSREKLSYQTKLWWEIQRKAKKEGERGRTARVETERLQSADGPPMTHIVSLRAADRGSSTAWLHLMAWMLWVTADRQLPTMVCGDGPIDSTKTPKRDNQNTLLKNLCLSDTFLWPRHINAVTKVLNSDVYH